MVSKVRTNMRTCNGAALVPAELLEGGETVKIHIESDCKSVKEYAQPLGDTISTTYRIDYAASKVFADENRRVLSMPCIAPCAIMNAVWMELGMLSESHAKKVGSNDNEFVVDDE